MSGFEKNASARPSVPAERLEDADDALDPDPCRADPLDTLMRHYESPDAIEEDEDAADLIRWLDPVAYHRARPADSGD